jgi:hypothetical protein
MRHCLLHESCPTLTFPMTAGARAETLTLPKDREEDCRGQDERDHGRRHVRGWYIEVHDWLRCAELGGWTVDFGGVLDQMGQPEHLQDPCGQPRR